MSRLHEAWERIPLTPGVTLISADQIRALTGREPRLMMKFDHSHQLPPALRRPERFILPLKNGLYAVIEGSGYHRPEHCGAPEEVDFATRFPLKTTERGLSEMQHLDIAYNSGLLARFLNEPVLYPTIRGRKRSPYFRFSYQQHQFEVEGVQVEIDGGFEGRRTIAVIEAKIGECDDFHLRQLYYPYRFWRDQTDKQVRPIFFTYCPQEQVYRLREYRFAPPDRYATPDLVRAAAYRISTRFVPHREDSAVSDAPPIPQADRLDKLAILPFLLEEGLTTPEAIAEALEFTPRQGRYYLDAARALGLCDAAGELSRVGRQYLHSEPEVRSVLLCRLVLGHPVIQQLTSAALLSPEGTLPREAAERVVAEASALSPSTSQRRIGTIWRWLQHVARFSPLLSVEPKQLRFGPKLAPEPEQVPPPIDHQLDLFGWDEA